MISVVIPLYNEEKNIDRLYSRISEAGKSWGHDFEVILVDDGSYDDTVKLLKEVVKTDSRFKIVKLSRNFGHQAAISAGLQHAKGDAVIIMDGDLQDPPEEVPRFLQKWQEGYHVVYAVRKNRKENIFKRAAYSTFYRLLALISDINIPLDSGDFCVMDRKVVDVLVKQMPEQNRFVRGLRAYAGFRQIGVSYERAHRHAGEVKYTFRKLSRLALDGLFDFSTFPLRLASYLGFVVALTSFCMGVFLIFHRILDFKILGYSPKDVPGNATLAVGIYFLGGIILIIIGIIGEYVGKIYFEVKRRPASIVEEVVSNNTIK